MSKIQTLWVDGKLGKMEKLCLKSFLKNGHNVHIYTYGEVKNAPEGVSIKKGDKILPREEIFTYNTEGIGSGSVAAFANYFRLVLLNKKGGWWVDTDVVCIKPFNFEEDRVISTSFEHEWGECAINCVMKMSPGDPILEYCIEKNKKMKKDEIEHGENGPHLLQEAVRKVEAKESLVDSEVFCPIGWRDTGILVKPYYYRKIINFKRHMEGRKKAKVYKKSHSVHLWNTMWNEEKMDKQKIYPKSSLYERLKNEYEN